MTWLSSTEVRGTTGAHPAGAVNVVVTNPDGQSATLSNAFVYGGTGLYTISPCRVADTRQAIGPYGGPALAAGGNRTFVIAGRCGIPTGASAVAFNFTITQGTGSGILRVGGSAPPPLASTLSWSSGQTRANNALIMLGPSGEIVVYVDQAAGTVQLMIDATGYFK